MLLTMNGHGKPLEEAEPGKELKYEMMVTTTQATDEL